ncbi:hypothetical protein HO173_003855 [Letharia columbiana]|uniref:2EXR domain-containing protein n=1 Tax=Letharia columbiana TaxID=112416 RepID=A0A8H6L6V0_9LECA|nr:uncharacterized protein HO173_003855 [Letharia columbiana]KAF6237654.1 hypothetical protein HO173_003855 [Letharia columbiana]
MLTLQRIHNRIPTTEALPLRPAIPPRSRFESLPFELRLQIYSLLLDGKPQYCHFEKAVGGRSYSTPKLYPAILAVNRSISAEAYPVLYGENTFLFLARNDWVGRLLGLAPAIKTIEFDFWVGFASIPTLDASIPAIKSLIGASTQTFRIGTRDFDAYHGSGFRFSRRRRVELPGMILAVVDLKGLDHVQEKSRLVHKALRFIIEIMGQRPPMPNNTIFPGQALVSVEYRVFLHKDFAGFWSSDEFTVEAETQG